MKAKEINLLKEGFLYSSKTYPKGSHCKYLYGWGRALPSCKSQMKTFLKYFTQMEVLNKDDVEHIESILNEYGLEGEYKYTKSKQWVRLINNTDLLKALKTKFK